MDPYSMAKDEDDNSNAKKFRYDNEESYSMVKNDDDIWLPELEELGGVIASFNKELNNPMLNDKNFLLFE